MPKRTCHVSIPKVGFKDLPVELVLRILDAATTDQTTYRSLCLVSHSMRDIVRLEFLRDLPVVLRHEPAFESFLDFVQSDPQIGSSIHYLWMIPLDYDSISLPEQILEYCPNIIALACQPQSLLSFFTSSSTPQLTSCKQLTLQDRLVASWSSQRPTFVTFCNQIDHLSLVGPFVKSWTVPSFPNVRTAWISHGQVPIDIKRFGEIFHDSAKLEKISLLLEHKKSRTSMRAETESALPTLTVSYLSKNWTDVAVWLDSLNDKTFLDTLCDRAPPKPRRTCGWW